MAAAGLPVPQADHVDRAVQICLDMVAAIVPLRQEIGVSWTSGSGLADERVAADARLHSRELPPDQVERVNVDENSLLYLILPRHRERPSAVSLVATKSVLPNPFGTRRSSGIPAFTRYFTTDSARRSDSFWLYFTLPTASQ
jgi:hypothetical protein